MRILANYGYKNNGDSYSVTFETVGDVPKENAHKVVDELFALAKSAIKRQVEVKESVEFPPKEKEEIVIPKPAEKDFSPLATQKQKNLIIRLAKERGKFIDNLKDLTVREASETIEDLMAVTV